MLRFLTIVALVLSFLTPAHADVDKDALEARIEKANYCRTKEDCVNAGLECPFACVPYVNKNEVEELRKAAHEYAKKISFCDQDCAPFGVPECVEGRCVPGNGELFKPHSK